MRIRLRYLERTAWLNKLVLLGVKSVHVDLFQSRRAATYSKAKTTTALDLEYQ